MEKHLPIIRTSSQIIADRIEIDGLLIFGSYARGDSTKDSDMDFVTLGDEFRRIIFDDMQPQLDVWIHLHEKYLRILNHTITQPFEDSLYLGILQESSLLIDDKRSIFSRARDVAANWVWSKDILQMLSERLELTQSLLELEVSEQVLKHIRQRSGLFDWNRHRVQNGLPLLRRLKDIHRTGSEAKIGFIVQNSSSTDRAQLQTLFMELTELVLSETNRKPFTEIKDVINAFGSSRFDEWILSMADSLLFLAGMGMTRRGFESSWKLLDVPSEVRLLEYAREHWIDYREVYDKFSELFSI